MSIKDGPSCPGCGLANYEGMCPHCRGDQEAYERELVPPFPSSRPFCPECDLGVNACTCELEPPNAR